MGKVEFDTIMKALGGISDALNEASKTLEHWEPIKSADDFRINLNIPLTNKFDMSKYSGESSAAIPMSSCPSFNKTVGNSTFQGD